MSKALLREIPAIDALLGSEQGAALCREFTREEVVSALRTALAQARAALLDETGSLPDFSGPAFFSSIRAALLAGRVASLRSAVNATGIILHTNLGRAPLAAEAVQAAANIARGYSNLEFDLATGRRGSRYEHVEELLTRLSGAEAALVVNNGAAAVVLALATFAKSREVVVSRGELIEIGGSFRMPDVIAQSGASMVEVGTTNKTRLSDYERAISPDTRVLLTTHPSNYRVMGFTAKPGLAELVGLAHRRDLMLMEDLGSGTLVDLRAHGLEHEPTVQESVAAGVDVLTFSGDKLLGGPQAGIILGRARYLDQLRRAPLLRALRIDKLSLAALEATLRLYLPPHDPLERVPVLRMIVEDPQQIGRRARRLLRRLRKIAGVSGEIDDGLSYAGGGSLPMSGIPTKVIRLRLRQLSAQQLARRLWSADPPVIGRLVDDTFTIDPRTLSEADANALIAAIESAAQ